MERSTLMIEPTNLPALVCPLCYLHANKASTVLLITLQHCCKLWALLTRWAQYLFEFSSRSLNVRGGAVIYRKVRQESKNICSLVQVNFVYNGHFILNSFSLTTQQTHIYRLGDTIRTRASDVTWEVGRIYYLVKRVPLQQLWEWSIYVVVMNVIFIRWWGEGRGGRGVMIVGSRHCTVD